MLPIVIQNIHCSVSTFNIVVPIIVVFIIGSVNHIAPAVATIPSGTINKLAMIAKIILNDFFYYVFPEVFTLLCREG